METAEKTRLGTTELYNEIYKNVKMGADSIINLLPSVNAEDSVGIKTELTVQLSKYEDFAHRASIELLELGETAKEENIMARMGAKMGVKMNTMIDSTPSHIAQMIIEGSVMGITDLLRKINSHKDESDRELSKAIELAREVIKFEEDSVEKMKEYL